MSGPLAAGAARRAERRRRRRRGRTPEPLPPRGTLFPPSPSRPRSPSSAVSPSPGEAGSWIHHDETWSRVVHRHEHRRLLYDGHPLEPQDDRPQPRPEGVRVEPDSIEVRRDGGTPDRWVYLALDPERHPWRDFRWTVSVTRHTDFRELQFGFRYVDFYNRYRVRHEGGRLRFDVVHEGSFYNDLAEAPLTMEPGRPYAFSFEIRKDRFVVRVDGEPLLDEIDPFGTFPRGSVALILWLPGVIWVAERIYMWVSRNRHLLSRWFGCKQACAWMPERQRPERQPDQHPPAT